jgi:hypothetical protein
VTCDGDGNEDGDGDYSGVDDGCGDDDILPDPFSTAC